MKCHTLHCACPQAHLLLQLVSLLLAQNQFSGTLPSSWGESKVSHAARLVLKTNCLDDQLAPSVQTLPSGSSVVWQKNEDTVAESGSAIPGSKSASGEFARVVE